MPRGLSEKTKAIEQRNVTRTTTRTDARRESYDTNGRASTTLRKRRRPTNRTQNATRPTTRTAVHRQRCENNETNHRALTTLLLHREVFPQKAWTQRWREGALARTVSNIIALPVPLLRQVYKFMFFLIKNRSRKMYRKR